jgi:zinc protease
VSSLTRDDLVRFHQTHWRPGSSALVFAGDISLAEATDWRGSTSEVGSRAAPAAEIPPARPVGPGKVFLVDRQDAAQTVVAHVLPAPRGGPTTTTRSSSPMRCTAAAASARG